MLVETERRVGGVGPGDAVALIVLVISGHDRRLVAADHGPAVVGLLGNAQAPPSGVDLLGATAVVGDEHDQGVIEFSGLPQGVDDQTDAAIELFDLSGVDLHPPGLPRGMFDLVPGLHPRVPGGQRPRRIDQPHGLHPPVPFRPEFVPSLVVAPLPPGDVLLASVQRPVRCGVRDVEQEGTILVDGGVPADVVDGLLVDPIGVVEVLTVAFDVVVPPGERHGIKEAARPVNRAVEGFEPPVERPVGALLGFDHLARLAEVVGDVPLPAHAGGVARVAEGFGHRRTVGGEFTAVALGPTVVDHVPHPRLVRIATGHERRPGGAAPRGVVEVREADPVGGEPVEVRGANLAPEAPDVRVAHVVGHDQHEVGAVLRDRRRGSGASERQAGHQKNRGRTDHAGRSRDAAGSTKADSRPGTAIVIRNERKERLSRTDSTRTAS